MEMDKDWIAEIKNQLVGQENEGFQLFRAESRVVDTANQYHLYVFEHPDVQVPLGFFDGRNVSNTRIGKSKQRPFENES